MPQTFSIGMLLFPDLTHLDLTGPHEVFSRIPNTKLSLVAEAVVPILAERGLAILPDLPLQDSPKFDLVFVPGGTGINAVMENEKILSWLTNQAKSAKYITSVCTGSLALAAAGLLDGFSATTHWLSLDILRLFPGINVKEDRIVRDGNRITGGGVTAGIDFALSVAADLNGANIAQEIQLMLEYDPSPPFNTGHPRSAPREILNSVASSRREAQIKRKEIAVRAIERLKS
ncbi:putative cyclohexyl-isocyanide hydratase [Leptospira inadai serovar Lyme str. 10]|uniref:Thiamine biosynthesis protein ThiJ n=2 Tax=Leptospira inadai serovar Lyme TaxID=293084 RepID=A0ABX4YID3_9LEPT|nr:DJ-1/PfpI family protein [Leptospira inadai]EQA38159.1 putative cyclohexyl-isocyanide hydratase [Leptospira inadai serovar Lyme str. 10]PNV74971.1 thiamine biosynthesis protein ThiJ [Leptospira inadai serovar Lyme]